jgi:hypothetical protein
MENPLFKRIQIIRLAIDAAAASLLSSWQGMRFRESRCGLRRKILAFAGGNR